MGNFILAFLVWSQLYHHIPSSHHSPFDHIFTLSSSHYGMDRPFSRPLERQWLLIDWLGLANTRRPTRWRRTDLGSSDFYLLPFTDRSRLNLYICSLLWGFLVWGTGRPSAAPEDPYPGACLSIYRVFELPCTPLQRFCHNFTDFAVSTLRLRTRLERVAESRWESYH